MTEWEVRPLGEVCRVVNGGTPKTSVPEYWGGEHRWITPAEMGKRLSPYVADTSRRLTSLGLSNCSASLAPANSVILSTRAPIGHLVINTEPMATNQGCRTLVPDSGIHDKYLYFYLYSIRDVLDALGTGATFRELSAGVLKSVAIPAPSLPEQQRIVGILDKAFDGIAAAKANAEKNLRNARALFESYLDSVFSRRAGGWVVKRLEQAASATCTLSYGIVQPGEEYPNGLPVVRPTDLTTKAIPVGGLKRIDPKRADAYRRTSLQGGELLLCVRGRTGVVSVASAELAGANVTRGIVPIRFDAATLSQDFGYYLLSSGAVQTQVREKTYGAALMQINIRDLRNITVSFPPLKEQDAVVARLDELSSETNRLGSVYQRKLAALDELKRSLLHQAFSGQL